MSETVAVALITGVPTATVAVAAFVFNFLQERWRRAHEDEQLDRRFEHEREMRLLEWRRADRLERLAPIREYLDEISREAVGIATEHGQARTDERRARLEAVIDRRAHTYLRSPDAELVRHINEITGSLRGFVEMFVDQTDEADKREALQEQLVKGVSLAWDRLDELQSDL